MSTDGAHDARQEARGTPPAAREQAVPPVPPGTPAGPGRLPLLAWLRLPRPPAPPGIWRLGHLPRDPREGRAPGDRELHGGALLSALIGLLVWSLCWNGYIRVWLWPLDWITVGPLAGGTLYTSLSYAYYTLFAALLAWACGRAGNWAGVWRRWRPAVLRRTGGRTGAEPVPPAAARRAAAVLVAAALVWWLGFRGVWTFWLEPLWALVPASWWNEGDTLPYTLSYNVWYVLCTALLAALAAPLGGWPALWRHYRRAPGGARPAGEGPLPGDWDEVRAVGESDAADRLAEETRSGAMNDLDYVRIEHAWRAVRSRPSALPGFGEAARTRGAAAFPHPSGDRDLAVRTARHDLLTRQVRIGRAADEDRNPDGHRGQDIALDPAVLGTSLVAVGPPGCGKTGRLVRPVTEALCLHALARQAVVVAVGTSRSGLGADDAFDIVVRVGDPAATHRLDLYGGAADTDEAAALLAEALTGGTGVDPGAAAAVLVQLIGPFRAAYGQLPGVPELRALLDGAPALLGTLREDLARAGDGGAQRELDARARAAQRPDDLAPRLADRLALLERAGLTRGGEGPGTTPFSPGVLEHPLRVRIDLPATGHGEAARILTRLLLGQFTASVTARPDRSLFACLILDDATGAVTPGAVRGLTHLRPANAGAVLALRTLDDVPPALRTGLLGAVGCRAVFSGITTWDAEHFARAWGTEWTEDRDVTRTPERGGGGVRRLARGVRKLFTGRETTTESVTVRRVERERWSASELAHRVPPRHAVVSLASVSGEAAPPVLVRLG